MKRKDMHIMIETYLYKPSNKKRNKVIKQCKLLNSKLEKLGYKVKYFDEEDEGTHFLTIYNKDKICCWGSSITPACCMANIGRRPLPLEWFLDMFDLIMSKDMDKKAWLLLEKISYIYHSKHGF